MTEYRFKYYNNKGILYFLMAVMGIPFLMLLLSFFLLDYISWIFWITVPVGVGLIVYSILKFTKASRGHDIITIDKEGFTSKDYGRVLFSEIHSIPPYGVLQAPPPSLRIKLNNGRKLVWQFNQENAKDKGEDALVFTAFRDVLFKHLKRQRQSVSSEVLEEIAKDSQIEADTDSLSLPKSVTASSAEVDIIEQLERHKKRDVNYKYLTVPIGLVVSVLFFVRTCGEDIIREHKDKELDGVRNIIQNEEVKYENNVKEALRVAKSYSKKFGPIYLYTNDSQAIAEFMPDIRKDPFQPEINMVGIRRMEDNKLLEKFIEHPDSVSYDLAILNQRMKFSAVMRRSLFAKEGSDALDVYFSAYNPTESLPSTLRKRSDTTFRPIRYSTSISIPKSGKLKKEVLENMDFASFRAILQQYKGTYVYMAVKQADGISYERFVELEKLVSANFESYGIDMSTFQSKQFNVEDGGL